MWIIKNPELKRKVNEFFTDEEIHNCYLFYRDDLFVSLEFEGFKDDPSVYPAAVSIVIPRTEFKAQYNPNEWNPFPNVEPPKSGEYLVQLSNGQIQNCLFKKAIYGPSPNDCSPACWNISELECPVIAFREMPRRYDELHL